jgi:polyphosphate kinase
MPRNLDYRIEVTCPIFDRSIKCEVRRIFDIQWRDNIKARIYDEKQSNTFCRDSNKPFRSQVEVYNYLKGI